MEELATLTSELKELLIDLVEYKDKEDFIFKHIESAEKLNYTVEDFPPNLDWFNTSEPLSREHLQGKIIVLDFFTYCCINCLHIIPHLRQLEENFSVADGLVVIGVHSAKFDNEKDSQNILLALKRYKITHPVVNDKKCHMWNKLGISCWPTMVILGPQKQPLFVLVGEGHRDELLLFVKAALKFYKKSISPHQLPTVPCDQIITSSMLSFPGKIARWKDVFAVSDSGNHRIIVFDGNGRVRFKIGGKTPGFQDGSFNTARFNSPQGLAFYNSNEIYVADTENHSIRLINLENLIVTTVVGNGGQGIDYEGGKIGTRQEISSPWDVCIVSSADVEAPSQYVQLAPFAGTTPGPPAPPPLPSASQPPPPPLPSGDFSSPLPSVRSSSLNYSTSRVLLIAVAGTHQIWAFFIEGGVWWKGKKYEKNTCVAIAGSGKEENRNNRYPKMASFAQPSGLTYSKELKSVFIADSESSSIRKLSLKDGVVSHVAGGAKSPNDLFSYGDVDGKGHEAKLQHPLGVIWSSKLNSVFVCDTYNHKIKKIEPGSGLCKSIKSCEFSEPSGGCLNEFEDILYICDTNNNSIKLMRLEDGSISKLELEEQSNQTVVDTPLKDVWEAETNLSKAGGALTVRITFMPKEIHGKWSLQVDETKIKADDVKGKLTTNAIEFSFNVLPSDVDDVVIIFFDLVLCGDEICAFKKLALKLHLRRKESGSQFSLCELSKSLKPWDDGSYYQGWSQNDMTEAQLYKCQEQYERGLAIASLCTPTKTPDSFVNNFQTEPPFQPPIQSSVGGPPHSHESFQYGLGGFLQPPPLPPLCPPNTGDGFYAADSFPDRVNEKPPPLEDRATFPSFRYMKIRKKVKICSSDPQIFLTHQQLEALSAEILERILTEEGAKVKPRFYGMKIRNGCLTTVCGDETTLFWLKKTTRDLGHGDMVGLKLVEESEEEKTFTAVGNFQQSQNDSNERILLFLKNQNEGLDVSRWKVVSRVPKSNAAVQLTFLIDFASAEMLKLKGDRLSYKFGVARLFLKYKHGGILAEEEIEGYNPDFLLAPTQFSNPFAVPAVNPNEIFQIPNAITRYMDDYKARITEMMEESKNSLLQGLASRNRFIGRKTKPRKKKRKIKEATTPS